MTLDERGMNRLREAFASLADVADSGRDCPFDSEIWSSVNRELDRERNEAVIEHLAKCSSCAMTWRMARHLCLETAGPVARDLDSQASPRPSRFVPYRMVRVAAAVAALSAIVFGVRLVFFDRQIAETPVFRAEQESWLISTTDETRPLVREACVLRWAAGPESTTYDLRVTTEDLDSIARVFRVDQPEYRIPVHSLAALPSGAKLHWQVVAHLPDGRSITSRTFTNVLE